MLEKICFAYREKHTPIGITPTCNALDELYCQKFKTGCRFYQHQKTYAKKLKLANERLFKLGLKLKHFTIEGDEEKNE